MMLGVFFKECFLISFKNSYSILLYVSVWHCATAWGGEDSSVLSYCNKLLFEQFESWVLVPLLTWCCDKHWRVTMHPNPLDFGDLWIVSLEDVQTVSINKFSTLAYPHEIVLRKVVDFLDPNMTIHSSSGHIALSLCYEHQRLWCSHMFPSSECVPQGVPNSSTLLSHMVSPKFSCSQLYRCAEG